MTATLQGTGEILATDENMPFILMALEAADDVAIDTETTGLNVRNGVDYLTGVCFDVPGLKGYIPFRHSHDNVSFEWVSPLFQVLAPKPLIWHNRKFDFHSVNTLGFDPRQFTGPQYDVLMIATLVDEELPSKELDWLAKRFLNESKIGADEIHKLGGIYGYANIPPVVMAPYGAQDAYITRRLRDVLWPKLVAQGLESVYWETEAPFTTALYRMERPGVGVNKELAEAKVERGTLRMQTIKRQLKFDPGSSKDLGNYLIDYLGLPVVKRSPKTGKPSFDKYAMEEYDTFLQAMDNPAAKLITEYRGWQKAVSSLYIPLLKKRGPDGRVRTNFNQHGTVTGRLSANDPNLQQVPRSSPKVWNGDAKACFVAGEQYPDYCVYGWDYSQVELRLAAAYGQEETLLAEFRKDSADPFRVLTPLIFHGQYSDDLRHKTKNGFVYPSLYGAGLSKVALCLGITNEEAQPLYQRYKDSIPGIFHIAEQVKQLVMQQGYVSYWDGRRRHIRNKDEVHTRAWNSVLQGGAAQLMKKAVLRCFEFASADCIPLLTVHDEITFLIKREAIPDYEPLVKKAMTDWPQFPVRFAIEGKEWK